MRDPIEIGCGNNHHLCRKCYLLHAKNSSSRWRDGGIKCPQCRELIRENGGRYPNIYSEKPVNRFLKRIIEEFPAKCVNVGSEGRKKEKESKEDNRKKATRAKIEATRFIRMKSSRMGDIYGSAFSSKWCPCLPHSEKNRHFRGVSLYLFRNGKFFWWACRVSHPPRACLNLPRVPFR